MARCTAPVQGHRTASGAANCPVCGSRSSYRPSYYTRPAPRYPSSGGDSYTGGRRISVGGRSVLVTAAEERTLAPVRDAVEQQAPSSLPERRDLFLCHAWDDRLGAAKELHDHLETLGVWVWFSEKDVGLGKPLLRAIDKGLGNSRAGIVLVTPALLKSLQAEGIADKELSVLLATDRVIPVAHDTTFDALRDVSPLLAARSGLSTGDSSMRDVATKVAAAAAAEYDT